MRTFLCLTLVLALVACSTGQPAPSPGRVATYGPASQTAVRPAAPRYTPAPRAVVASAPVRAAPVAPRAAPVAPRMTRVVPQATRVVSRAVPVAPRMSTAARPVTHPVSPTRRTAPRATSGPFRWHTRIADAQEQARRENKLILVGSTKPGCSLCVKFKTRVVPQASAQVTPVAVGYMLDLALTPEAPHIWQQLKANLPRANLMPLVGIFTPDLRYLTGFSGPADTGQLLSALATARRLYPISARGPERHVRSEGRTAQLNEYGEYEWTPLDEILPRPEDALTPEATAVASRTLLPPASSPGIAPAPIVAALPAAPVPPRRVAPPPVISNRPVVAAPVTVSVPAPVTVARKPVTAPPPKPPFHREERPALETWGEQALRDALEQIRRGDLDRAKTTLAEVHARLPGSTLAREASKGTVAIYSAKRIQDVEGAERDRRREEAERNLGHSMWGVLFRS